MKHKENRSCPYGLLAIKAILLALTWVMALWIIPLTPAPGLIQAQRVYAGRPEGLVIEHVSGFSVVQGETISLCVEIRNEREGQARLEVSLSDGKGDFTVTKKSQSAAVVSKGSVLQAIFEVKASRVASSGDRSLTVTVRDMDRGEELSEKIHLNVSENLSPSSGSAAAAFDISLIQGGEGLQAGKVTQVGFELFNKGNTYLKNTLVTLALPEGLSIQGGSNSVNLGYVTIGSAKRVEFPVTVEEETPGKNQPFTLKISGLNREGENQSVEQVFYLPVLSEGKKEKAAAEDLTISQVTIPKQVPVETDFQLRFQVSNPSGKEAKAVRVSVEGQEGMINKTSNVFLIDSLEKGRPQSFSVTFFAPQDQGGKFQPFKITVQPQTQEGKEGQPQTQYTGLFVEKKPKEPEKTETGEKTPQLMVSDYAYPGGQVQAGSSFPLSITLKNTSAGKEIRNIKVTVSSEEGTFLPVSGSNSYFIERIRPRAAAEKTLQLAARPDAEQKTSCLSVAMSYEDEQGNGYTATDQISVALWQESRLVVEEPLQPPELYPQTEAFVNVQFYNMGKTVLHNLRVQAEGDFDVSGQKLYFVGNMAAGSGDYYDLTLIPRQEGPMEGRLIFTYENDGGEEIVYEKPFLMTVESSPWEEEGFGEDFYEDQASPGSGMLPLALCAGGLAGAAGGLFMWRKKKKKGFLKALSLERPEEEENGYENQ